MNKLSLSKKSKKILVAMSIIAVMTSLTVVNAFALGTADATVTSAFTDLKDDVLATLAVVAALGVGVMAVFLAWKYGRKIFNQVAK